MQTGIRFDISFGQWEAAHGAGLDLWKWDNNVYSNQFKAKVIAWWGLHCLVNTHTEDAMAAKEK